MDTTRIASDQARGDAVLIRVLVALMSDEQLEHALNGCRDNATEADFAHAARVLEHEVRDRLAECPKCYGSGSRYVPDPDGWSSLKRREPEYIVCDGCGGSGRVPR